MGKRFLWRALRWLVSAAVLVLVVVTVMFLLLELTPGEPIQALIGNMPVPDDVRASLAQQFGLDRPLFERYLTYMGNMLTGDFGFSYASRQQVLPLVWEKLQNTLVMTIPALILSAALGIAIGAWSAITRNRVLDNILSVTSIALFSLPGFWVGLMLILIFAVRLDWLPTQGMRSYTSTGSYSIPHLILPVLTLTITEFAFKMRLMRASMIEVLGQDFIDTARSKGLSRGRILWSHALPNSMLPMITVIGYSIGYTIAGTVLVEKVFGWPGMGMLLYDSIQRSENLVVMAILFVASVSIIVINLLTDLILGLVDPRIRARIKSGGGR